MATIDLTAPLPPPTGLLDSLPRRVTLTLPELRLAAELASGAPLPFDVADPADPNAASDLEGRLGRSRASIEDEAYYAALDTLHDPGDTLRRRGLLSGDALDRGPAGALGLLATPDVAVDLDVTVEGVRAHAWHRAAGGAVATLATADGVVFELAWFRAAAWADELARAAMVPADLGPRDTPLPELVDLPYELLDSAVEAVRHNRADLVPMLAAHPSAAAVDAQGDELRDDELASIITTLATDARGRLRALVADVSGDQTRLVGVVSWVLLADGWRALRPHRDAAGHWVEVRRVSADDLAGDLAFVLSEVVA